MRRTNLVITCTCRDCGATYFAESITGGLPIDGDSTMKIAEANERRDKVQIQRGKNIVASTCNCKKGDFE